MLLNIHHLLYIPYIINFTSYYIYSFFVFIQIGQVLVKSPINMKRRNPRFHKIGAKIEVKSFYTIQGTQQPSWRCHKMPKTGLQFILFGNDNTGDWLSVKEDGTCAFDLPIENDLSGELHMILDYI